MKKLPRNLSPKEAAVFGYVKVERLRRKPYGGRVTRYDQPRPGVLSPACGKGQHGGCYKLACGCGCHMAGEQK